MKSFIATLALSTALVSPAFAGDGHSKDKEKMKTEAEATMMTPETGFTDQAEWVNKAVYDADMYQVGEVERVSFDAEGEVDQIVVETGGILEIGGKEILLTSDQYALVTAEGDDSDPEIQLAMTAEAFNNMPAFDEDKATDYPLSDNDMWDGVEESEGEVDVDVETDTYN